MTRREEIEVALERRLNPENRKLLEVELACPPFPEPLRYLWTAYWRLRRRKGGTGFGPSPIGWTDIDAFVRYTRLRLLPFELEVIEMVDDVFMAQQAKQISQASQERPEDAGRH